jgi:hypothetical protein
VTTQAPFDPSTDTTRARVHRPSHPVACSCRARIPVGVSYISIFIVSYHITFWVFGAAASLAWDYRLGVPQGAAAEHRVSWHEKPIGGWVYRRILRKDARRTDGSLETVDGMDVEKGSPTAEQGEKPSPHGDIPSTAVPSSSDGAIAELSRVPSNLSTHSRPSLHAVSVGAPDTPVSPVLPPLLQRVLAPARAVLNPITVTLVVALVIALVDDLKALFVPVAGANAGKWHGPDGRPPLAFVVDTGTFRRAALPTAARTRR